MKPVKFPLTNIGEVNYDEGWFHTIGIYANRYNHLNKKVGYNLMLVVNYTLRIGLTNLRDVILRNETR